MFPDDVGGGRIMFQLFQARDDRKLSQELRAYPGREDLAG
jgi:hypothetical protein